MGAGPGGDTGAQAAITPDMLAPEDDSLAALVRRLEAIAAIAPGAMAEGGDPGDVTRINLAHQVRDAAAALSEAGAFYRAGLADGRAECPVPLPPPRKTGGHRKDHPHLKLLGFLPAPLAGWIAKHAVAVKASAAVIAAVSVPAGALAIHAALAGPAYPAQAFGAGGAAPAASIEGAAPIGDPSFIAKVTKPGLDSRSSRQQNDPDGALAPVIPPSAPATSSGGPAAAGPFSPPSSSAPSGPAVLAVDAPATIDLSGGGTATFTISASGAGWVAWRVDTTDPVTGLPRADLDFSPMSGVLKAGDSVTVTVSVDPAQATDGNLSEVFTVAGQQVTVTLPAPAASPAATVAPSPAGS